MSTRFLFVPEPCVLFCNCFLFFFSAWTFLGTVADQYFGLDGDRANVRIITQSEKVKSAKKMPLLALYIPSGSRNRSTVCWAVFRLRAIRSFCILARVVLSLNTDASTISAWVSSALDGRTMAGASSSESDSLSGSRTWRAISSSVKSAHTSSAGAHCPCP